MLDMVLLLVLVGMVLEKVETCRDVVVMLGLLVVTTGCGIFRLNPTSTYQNISLQ